MDIIIIIKFSWLSGDEICRRVTDLLPEFDWRSRGDAFLVYRVDAGMSPFSKDEFRNKLNPSAVNLKGCIREVDDNK